MTPPDAQFSAAVLAGGRSDRMGADKAFLSWNGRRLIDRQLHLIRELAPAEVLVSGRRGVDYAVAGVRIILDADPGQGPLGGLAAVLAAVTAPHLLVVAVDLPELTSTFLAGLLEARRPGIGVVPRTPSGWESLAAVYPAELLPLARRHLDRGDFALHRLVDAGIAAGLLVAAPVPEAESGLFRNLNSPDD